MKPGLPLLMLLAIPHAIPGVVAEGLCAATFSLKKADAVGNDTLDSQKNIKRAVGVDGVVSSVLDNIVSPDERILNAASKVRRPSSETTPDSMRYGALSDDDFRIVAEELGVETAAIKAVVSVEAGSSMKGFWLPGVPVVNFSAANFARFKVRHKCPGNPDSEVPEGLKGYGLKEWTQLAQARKQNEDAADLSTFWGMFQIAGFNYARCGCGSVEEFVALMSYSELEQLELFAAFIKNAGMAVDLKNKNWAAFARKYNGSGYAKRGYHTKMAKAYKRYVEEERSAELLQNPEESNKASESAIKD